VSTSELSAVELVQSVIDKIKCPKGTDIWLGDTGASQHYSKNKVGATNICNAGQVSVGLNGKPTPSEPTFDLQGQFVHHDGHWDFGQSSRMLRTTAETISICMFSISRLACSNLGGH
jgi:hypothetical protein